MTNKIQTRSLSLDILKVFLSFFVVMGHLRPLFSEDSIFNWYFSSGFCRVLVPCFFMISGFFIMPKVHDKKYIIKYVCQLYIIYIVWSLFYAQFYFSDVGWETIIGRFLFGWYQLWYLPALFSGVIILVFALKWIKNDLFLLVLILLIYFLGHALDVTRSTHGVMAHWYRNGFFIGFPFLAFGYFIRKYDLKKLFTTSQVIISLILGLILLIVETTVYYYDNLKFSDMYLAALIICPAVIILCLKHPFKVQNSVWVEYFSDIPTGVYYIHLFFVFKMMTVDYNIYMVPVVFLVSVAASIPIIFVNRHLPMRLLL